MSAKNFIEINRESIGNILKKNGLRVPVNQRSYAWKSEHVKALYDDLELALNKNVDEYFLGSIVVVASNEATEVYDGQQRLATCMILIAAVRDYFYYAGDKKTALLIEDASLFSTDRRTHEESFHFSLNSEDQEYFRTRVLVSPSDQSRMTSNGSSNIESHERINEAANLAKEFIKDFASKVPASETRNWLNGLLDYLENSARVVWVEVPDERTAFTIFETMNDRGLKLSAADLLKNYLYAISENRKDQTVKHWQSMVATLETLGDDGDIVEFIRCYWITKNGHTRSKDLYNLIKKEANSKVKAVALAADLDAVAMLYVATISSSSTFWATYEAGAKRGIATLRELGVSQLRPLLLAATQHFSKKEITKLVTHCVSWSVRCLVGGVPSGTLEGYYSRNANNITSGKVKNATQVASDMKSIVPDNKKFKNAFSTINVSNAKLARYYLRTLQLADDNDSEPMYIPNDGIEVTLEHILPQRPGTEWSAFDVESARVYRNRLGNQVLLSGSVNSKLGNISYEKKKKEIEKSEFSLTKAAGEYEDWTSAEIDERQLQLADLAVKAWPLLG